MGDTAIVLAGVTWLIANAAFLSINHFGDTIIEPPSNPYTVKGATTNTMGTADVTTCVLATVGGAFLGGAAGFLLGFGVGGIAGAAAGAGAAGAILGCSVVRKAVIFILNLLDIVLNFFGFLFDLLTFNVPRLSVWAHMIVIGPPAFATAFVALKTMNRAGG